MCAQILDGVLETVVGGDLLCLAPLHCFEVRENYFGKQLGQGGKRIAHEQILSRNCEKRLITSGRALVMLPANPM